MVYVCNIIILLLGYYYGGQRGPHLHCTLQGPLMHGYVHDFVLIIYYLSLHGGVTVQEGPQTASPVGILLLWSSPREGADQRVIGAKTDLVELSLNRRKKIPLWPTSFISGAMMCGRATSTLWSYDGEMNGHHSDPRYWGVISLTPLWS